MQWYLSNANCGFEFLEGTWGAIGVLRRGLIILYLGVNCEASCNDVLYCDFCNATTLMQNRELFYIVVGICGGIGRFAEYGGKCNFNILLNFCTVCVLFELNV